MHYMAVIPAGVRALIDWFIYIFGVLGIYFFGEKEEAETEAAETEAAE